MSCQTLDNDPGITEDHRAVGHANANSYRSRPIFDAVHKVPFPKFCVCRCLLVGGTLRDSDTPSISDCESAGSARNKATGTPNQGFLTWPTCSYSFGSGASGTWTLQSRT